MTDERTCRCKGQFAMHKPALHADRDGSERPDLQRELLRGLAADKAEPDQVDEERVRKYAEALGKHWPVSDMNLGYYRTEVTCACGETYWGGQHEGDPSLAHARALHEAAPMVALAHAEQAEMRAENGRLRRELEFGREDALGQARIEVSERLGSLLLDKKSAEAALAEAQARLAAIEALRDAFRDAYTSQPDIDAWAHYAAERIDAALAVPAEPEATE